VPNVERRLAAFAAAVIVGHHVGTLFEPLGELGTTSWADWIDLLVPYATVGLAIAVLAAADAGRGTWTLLVAGAIAYTQGHGIHLAANSIARVSEREPAHLWDEVVGHWLWYGGLTIVVVALVRAVERRPLPSSPWAYALALLFGATVFTNSVEGGTAPLGIAASVAFVAWGMRRRGCLPWLLVPAYGIALLALLAWAAYWGGFPQFSELGWL
jgi:hypothetical protein